MARKHHPIGTRVVAVSHNEGRKLFVFGRGVFEGCFVPPAINMDEAIMQFQQQYAAQQAVTPDLPQEFTADEARKGIILSQANPRIRLTETMDGTPLDEVVWGYECWWGTEEEFNTDSGKFEIITVTVEQHRADVEKMQAEADAEEAQLHAALCSMTGHHTHDEN